MATATKTKNESLAKRRAAAEERWSEHGTIRNGFRNVEREIVEAIKNRDWELLGYDSFSDLWDARMKGVRLATDGMKRYVISQMIQEGMTAEEVVKASGAGDVVVKRVERQIKEFGITDPDEITLKPIHVKPFDRRVAAEPYCLKLEFSASEIAAFNRIAKAAGVNRDEYAKELVRDGFMELDRRS